jgi:hypothetical protein
MSENNDIKIEVFEDHLMLILPRIMDDFITPWENAWKLGAILEQVAESIKVKDSIIDSAKVERESGQIALNTHQNKYVCLLFRHTDRIKLSYHSAIMVARAIKMKAQDLDYLKNKRIKLKSSPFFRQRQLPL